MEVTQLLFIFSYQWLQRRVEGSGSRKVIIFIEISEIFQRLPFIKHNLEEKILLVVFISDLQDVYYLIPSFLLGPKRTAKYSSVHLH